MSIAAVLRELMAAGVQGEALVAAVDRIEKADKVEKGAARAARNRRYYEKRKASEQDDKTSKTSETTDDTPPLDRFPPPAPPPSLNPSRSDPNGSGSASEPIDPRADLFGRCVGSLSQMTGKAAPQCKALMGRWLKLVEDSAVAVVVAIDEAEEARPANPVPWIEMRLKREAANHVSGTRHYANGHAAGGGYGERQHDPFAAALARREDRRHVGLGQRHSPGREGRTDPSGIADADWSDAGERHRAHRAA